jgi:formylglycine-generating enzyme required for sulfatase activity
MVFLSQRLLLRSRSYRALAIGFILLIPSFPGHASPAAVPAGSRFEYATNFAEGLPPDWSLQSATGSGSDQGRPALILSGQRMSFANLRSSLASGEFSGRFRITDMKGPDNWVGLEWGVRQRGSSALAVGGYFLTLYPGGGAHVMKGPWRADSRTIADVETGLDPTKPVDFRVVFAKGHHEVYLGGVRRFSFDDDTFPTGYCGVICYSQESMAVALYEARFKGEEYRGTGSAPAPVASAAAAATAVGQKESYAIGGLSFAMAYVQAKAFPTSMDDKGIGEVANDFLIGDTEVPYELWKEVYGWATDPTRGGDAYSFGNAGWQGAIPGNSIPPVPFGTPRHPVTMINWRTAIVWCNALTEWYDEKTGAGLDCVYYADSAYAKPLRDSRSEFKVELRPGSDDMPFIKAESPGNLAMEACAARGFRLPTRAEWELAARYVADRDDDGDLLDPGEATPGYFAAGAAANVEDPAATAAVAVYKDDSGAMTQPVGSKAPTALGLYDMSGNVYEWNFDGDPAAAERPMRSAAGGAWNSSSRELSIGGWMSPTLYYYNSWWGLRVARDPLPGRPGKAIGEEMLVNGDFSAAGAFWGVWFDPQNSAGLSDLGGGEARIDVAKGGSVQLGYHGKFPVSAGQWYRLSYELSGTEGHRVTAELGEAGTDYDGDGNVWTRYYGSEAVCGAATGVVTKVFRIEKSNPGLRINFHVGDANEVEVAIDSVSLTRVAKP